MVPPRFPTEAERVRRENLCALLDDGLVYVHLDARHPEASLPEHLAGQTALVLKLSHLFHLETFELGTLAVVAGLSFGGSRFNCVLPYDAMFAFSTEEKPFIRFFPDAAPEGVLEALAVAIRPAPEEFEEGALEEEADTADEVEPAEQSATPRPDRTGPPSLRLVK